LGAGLTSSTTGQQTERTSINFGLTTVLTSARPSYPSEALKYIRQEVAAQVSGPINVVEYVSCIFCHKALGQSFCRIGSGTGIFTRAFLAHPSWESTIEKLTAVEPSEGMRAVFDKFVRDERVSCQEGSFVNTGIPDHSADLVVVAQVRGSLYLNPHVSQCRSHPFQAFHWCPDYDAAAAEFSRILKPHGLVALIWNLEDR
jgi:SAM-dependent methyltransferase